MMHMKEQTTSSDKPPAAQRGQSTRGVKESSAFPQLTVSSAGVVVAYARLPLNYELDTLTNAPFR